MWAWLLPFLTAILTSIGWMLTRTFSIGVGLAIAKVLGFLGIGYVTYSGSMMGIDYFVSHIEQQLVFIPETIRDFVFAAASQMRLDTAISIIFSAYSLKMSIFAATKLKFSPSVSLGS